MKKVFSLLLFSFLLYGTASAQLSDFKVVSIEPGEQIENGPVHKRSKRPWALIKLVATGEGSTIINGKKIEVLELGDVVPPAENDDKYDAYAAGWSNRRAEYMVLHHPDFRNLKINFADYLGENKLEGGRVYRIMIELPSLLLIEANNAYRDLNFEKAAQLYGKMLENGNAGESECAMAREYLDNMDSLISYRRQADNLIASADALTGREKDRNLYRAKIIYNKISKLSNVIKADIKLDSLNKALGIEQIATTGAINELRTDSAMLNSFDLRASGNEAVTYTAIPPGKTKPETYKCALLLIKAQVGDFELISDISYGKPEKKDGETWLYVKTDWNTDKKEPDKVLLTVIAPGYKPLDVKLSDIGDIDRLEGESTYVINIGAPSPMMALANNKLSSLDFDAARNLFGYNYESAEEQQYADKCLRLLSSLNFLVATSSLESDERKCRTAEREYFSIVTGHKEFGSDAERMESFNAVNKKLDGLASKLKSSYRSIERLSRDAGIDLELATEKAEDYESVSNGVRSLPLTIEFIAMNEEDKVYRETEISDSPCLLLEFVDGKRKKTYEKRVKDNKISLVLDVGVSRSFANGSGKLKISAPGKLNGNKELYKSTEFDIADFKVSDYLPKKMKVTLIKK